MLLAAVIALVAGTQAPAAEPAATVPASASPAPAAPAPASPAPGAPQATASPQSAPVPAASPAQTAAPALPPEPDRDSLAARVELHPVQTLTLDDAQFLKGDHDGRPVTVAAELRIAQGTGRRPVVVLIHGSGGIGPNVEYWSRTFNALGISTFALDGFTGRGLVSVGTDQARLGRLNMVLDAYRMLNVLAAHPRVDPTKVILMGFSRGGQATLYASLKRFHTMWNTSGIGFAAYVPFYPDCMTTYQSDADVVDRPVRIFHGTPDDYNPPQACRSYVERLRQAGRDVAMTEYPDAQHGFDNPLGSARPATATDAQTVRACRIVEESPGRLVNAATMQPFSYADACVQKNPHVNFDAAATRQAREAVVEFVQSITDW